MKACALLLALAAAVPAAAQNTIEVPYTQFTLPNGLHVILHEDHSVPLVTVNMWYHVGSARERQLVRDRSGNRHRVREPRVCCANNPRCPGRS